LSSYTTEIFKLPNRRCCLNFGYFFDESRLFVELFRVRRPRNQKIKKKKEREIESSSKEGNFNLVCIRGGRKLLVIKGVTEAELRVSLFVEPLVKVPK
jgi:hypothetical protein